jgi:ADP-heptose:LPS heptosyltransferase
VRLTLVGGALRWSWRRLQRRVKQLRFSFCKPPDIALEFGRSPGDDLLMTPLIRKAAAGGGRIWIFSDFPELFFGNPAVERILPYGDTVARSWLAGRRTPVTALEYSKGDYVSDCFTSPTRHIVLEMASKLGFSGTIDVTPEIFLTVEERDRFASAGGTIAVSPSGLAKRLPMLNKEWFFSRFQDVRDRVSDYEWVQIGSRADPLLGNVRDYRGRLSIRESAALLANSACFVGQVGFQMHLARSVGCPSVIIFGGREKPWQSGYDYNINLSTDPACSPCWRYNRCEFDRRCMSEISVDQVVSSIRVLVSSLLPDRRVPQLSSI